MPDAPDAGLLARFVQGDQDAFETLFRQFETDVHRWILRIVRERAAADDVLVEAFWRAYRSRAQFDASRSFGAWMRRISTNAAFDHLKASKRQRTWPIATEQLPAAPAHDARAADAIHAALARLPPKLRVVATLAVIEEQPYADIADALGVPVGTVKSRVFKATRLLREELARLGIKP